MAATSTRTSWADAAIARACTGSLDHRARTDVEVRLGHGLSSAACTRVRARARRSECVLALREFRSKTSRYGPGRWWRVMEVTRAPGTAASGASGRPTRCEPCAPGAGQKRHVGRLACRGGGRSGSGRRGAASARALRRSKALFTRTRTFARSARPATRMAHDHRVFCETTGDSASVQWRRGRCRTRCRGP